jgi:hypothetical protein
VFFSSDTCIYNQRGGHEPRRTPDRAALPRGQRQPPRRAARPPRCGLAATTVSGLRGRRRRPGRDRPPGPGRPAGRHPPLLPARQDSSRLRLPDEQRADPQPGPFRLEPGVPRQLRPLQRGRPQGRRRPGTAGRAGHEPLGGLPDGAGPLPRQDLGRLAQAGRRRRRPGPHGHPPQRHPPQVRELHRPRHGPARRRGDELRPAHRLQPLSGMQTVRGGVPGRRHLPGRRFPVLQLPDSQLPGVHGRLLRLGREGGEQQHRPQLPGEGQPVGDGLDVAVAVLRAELQGGVLPGRLPRRRRRDRPLPDRPGELPQGHGATSRTRRWVMPTPPRSGKGRRSRPWS